LGVTVQSGGKSPERKPNDFGDPLDIEALFDEVYPPLFRYCHRLTADPDVAEDVAQETFTRLLTRRPAYPADGLRSWMFRVATNLIRDRARLETNRARILAGIPRQAQAPSPEGRVEQEEVIRTVRETLDTLSPRDREILLLRQEGLRYREIARILDVAPTSVGTLLARALKRFADAYKKENDGNGTP
jgi:RNA polymerase sigma-70 factor (ECF subfamily)